MKEDCENLEIDVSTENCKTFDKGLKENTDDGKYFNYEEVNVDESIEKWREFYSCIDDDSEDSEKSILESEETKTLEIKYGREYEKLKVDIILMNNVKSEMCNLFACMEKEAESLTGEENCVQYFNLFNKIFNDFMKEYEHFKSFHQSFVEDFLDFNEQFVFKFENSITDLATFDEFDQNMSQVSFKEFSSFHREYQTFTDSFTKMLDYYVRIAQYFSLFKVKSNEDANLKIAYWNCCGLERQKNEIKKYLLVEDLDIFLLQGTNFSTSFRSTLLNYHVFKNKKSNNINGGTLALINRRVCSNPEELKNSDLLPDNISNYQILRLPLEKCELTIVNLYNSYYFNADFDLTRLMPLLTEYSLIIGDFSVLSEKWGDDFTNDIGKNIEEFLNMPTSNFEILNRCISASDTALKNRIVDLTLCSIPLLPYISWKLSECHTSNNRRVIRFVINLAALINEKDSIETQ